MHASFARGRALAVATAAVALGAATMPAAAGADPTDPVSVELNSAFLLPGGIPRPQGSIKLQTALRGAVELPVPGDPDGSGTAQIFADAANNQICYNLNWSGITNPLAAHIHKAPSNSFTVVPSPALFDSPTPVSSPVGGCVTWPAQLVQDIVNNPSAYYVNVHNQDYPAGALRGQL